MRFTLFVLTMDLADSGGMVWKYLWRINKTIDLWLSYILVLLWMVVLEWIMSLRMDLVLWRLGGHY